MQEGLEENTPPRESNKAFREGKRERAKSTRIQNRKERQTEKFNKALAEDDAETGFVSPNKVEVEGKKETVKSSRFERALAKDDAQMGFTPSPSIKKTGEAILGAVTSDPKTTYSDLQETPNLVETANKEEQKINAQADKVATQLVNSANAVANANTSEPTEGESVYQQARALAGDGTTLANITAGAGDKRPTAEQYYTKADFEKEVAKQLAKENENTPEAVVDKLGLEEYYPNIGKDIAVGTYSGKYIGSATIFSAPGARLPMGLYDARKRAIRDAAQAKQAAMDKMYETPDAAKQLNDAFQPYYIDWVSNALKEAGGYDAFVANPENRKEMLRLQNLAKETVEINTRVEELKAAAQGKDGKQGAYLSKGTRAKIIEWQNGAVEGFDDILAGKKKISQLNQYFKSYANGVVWADDNMKNWNDTVTELPMNLKTNKGLTEAQLGELENARKAVADKSMDYDTYVDVIKKYVSVDVDSMVNSWADYSGYDVDDDAREDLKEYISSQIKDESLVANFEMQANKNYEYWAKKYDRANELEDKKSFYTQFYENAINGNIDQKLAGAREQIKAKPGATVQEKTGIMATALQGMGWATEKEYKKDRNGITYGYVYHRDVLTNAERKSYSLSKEPAKIELLNKKTNEREFVTVDYANKYRNQFIIVKDSDEESVLDAYMSNKEVKVVDNERRSYAGYSDNKGNLNKVTSETLGAYDWADNKTIITETYASPVTSVPKRDADGNHLRDPDTKELLYDTKKLNVKISYSSNLQNENDRNTLDVHRGEPSQKIAGLNR